MGDQITTDRLNESGDPTTETQNADQLQSVRAELITLAEKGEIKHSVAYIKKASHSALEKIKGDYERKQLEETNDYLSETLMGKLSEFMEATNMIDDAKSMEEELAHNKMVKRDLGAVYMEAGLARLARQPGKRDEFVLCLYEKNSSRLPG